VKILVHNFYVDLSSNQATPLLPCKVCGKENLKEKRVDTENPFGENESFCLGCWGSRMLDKRRVATLRV
jgi:hypothetical protein